MTSPKLGLIRATPRHAAVQPDVPTFAECVANAQAEEKAGRSQSARLAFEQALQRIRTADDARQSTNVLRWIARHHHFEGNSDAALDCLEAAFAVAEAWGDDAAAGHAMNVRAVVCWQRGELDEAERLYLLARERAVRAGDAKLAAMTAQNLGVLANIRGDFQTAEQQYRASLADYRSLGLTSDVCVALNNLGLLYIALERWDDAQAALLEATQMCEVTGDVVARTQLDINLAGLWVKRGDYGRAQAVLRQALAAAGQTGDASAIGKATKLLGVVARETGNYDEAESLFLEAEDVATARGELLLQAEIARDRADLARRTGRNRDVLQQLNRAHRLFGQLRAQPDLTDIDDRVGDLEQEFLHVARRWGESIEAKDRYTQGHCQRVAELACAIAVRSGFGERELFWFRIGALLHDVGKLVIPPEVLNKPGKLDDDEWQLMRSHTTAGVEMLRDIEFPWDVSPMVESHHERWDGKGYPHGLSGEAIPLVARILAIADVYDALTSVRSYKRALTHQDTMEILRRDVGTVFDPAVFARFEEIAADWPTRIAHVVESAPDAAHDPSTETRSTDEYDELTGMSLRRAFRDTAQRVLEARQTTGRPVSLLVIDIDGFKAINQSFGHTSGDSALRLVADQIRANTRPTDHLARYADDEFVVLLPGIRIEDARAVAERIREAVANGVIRTSEQELRVTVSIGVSCTRTATEGLDALFGAADEVLFSVKRTGLDTVAVAKAQGKHDGQLHLPNFVGRVTEQQRLRSLIAGSSKGDPRLVIVSGEAGSGKSTLLNRFAPELGMRGGALLVGRCIESGAGNAYGPWADIILAAHRGNLVERRSWEELELLVPGIGNTDRAGKTPQRNGGSQRALLLEIEEFLRVASTTRPLMVIIESMQWADDASWDVLEFLLSRLRDQRLLIGITVRSEDVSEEGQRRLRRLSRFDRCSELPIGRLSRTELEQWLSSALHGYAPSEALLDHVVQQSEGNAFFAVQTLRALADDKHLERTADGWTFDGCEASQIPRAIDDLLARRVERLTQQQRDILALAAVLGREFDSTALVAAYEGDELTVHEALDTGLATGILATTTNPRATLTFTHALLTHALLSSMNPLRRQRLHARVARAMDAMPSRDATALVVHYDLAGLASDAFRTAVEAGEGAQSLFAWENASRYYLTALRNAADVTQVAQVEWRLAQLEESRGRIAEAEECCSRLLATGTAGAGATGLLGPARRMQLRLRMQRGVPSDALLETCASHLAEVDEAAQPGELSALFVLSSTLRQRLGDMDTAEALARAAVEAAERSQTPSLVADALIRLGSAVFAVSPANAIPHYRRALDMFVTLSDRVGQMKCQINIGSACDRAGNLPAAEGAYSTAIDIGRAIRARDLSGVASLNLGVLLLKTGKPQDARVRFEDACRLFTSIGHEPYRLAALYNLGHLARLEHDPAGALELYGTCIDVAERISQSDVHIGAACGAGLTLLDLNHRDRAAAQLELAKRLVGDRTAWWFQGREQLEALAVRIELSLHGEDRAAQMLLHSLRQSEAHDSYATLWLAAECAELLRHPSADAERDRLQRRARALGYEPLANRLRRIESDSASQHRSQQELRNVA